jgi:cell division septation protein DedD
VQPAGADSPRITLRPALDQPAKPPVPAQPAKQPVTEQASQRPVADQPAKQPAVEQSTLPAADKPPAPVQPARQAAANQSAEGEVQLGAFRSEAEARAAWAKAQTQAAELLSGREPRVVVADLPGKGRYYRLRVIPASGVSQRQFCDSLTAKGLGCFPVRD